MTASRCGSTKAWDSDVDMSSCCTGYPHWEHLSILWAIIVIHNVSLLKSPKMGYSEFWSKPVWGRAKMWLSWCDKHFEQYYQLHYGSVKYGTWNWLDDWHGNRLNICLRGSSAALFCRNNFRIARPLHVSFCMAHSSSQDILWSAIGSHSTIWVRQPKMSHFNTFHLIATYINFP